MWLTVTTPDQMRTDLFDPFRIHARHTTGKQPRCFGKLRRDDPLAGFLLQIRPGMHDETDTARAQIIALLF